MPCIAMGLVEGFHGDDQTWSWIMPTIFDMLYREYCRARLTEMRKQLLLWPGPPEDLEVNRDADRPDGTVERGVGSEPSHEGDSHGGNS